METFAWVNDSHIVSASIGGLAIAIVAAFRHIRDMFAMKTEEAQLKLEEDKHVLEMQQEQFSLMRTLVERQQTEIEFLRTTVMRLEKRVDDCHNAFENFLTHEEAA